MIALSVDTHPPNLLWAAAALQGASSEPLWLAPGLVAAARQLADAHPPHTARLRQDDEEFLADADRAKSFASRMKRSGGWRALRACGGGDVPVLWLYDCACAACAVPALPVPALPVRRPRSACVVPLLYLCCACAVPVLCLCCAVPAQSCVSPLLA